MPVVIRLSRTGKTNAARYRVTVADSRYSRDGKFLENVGYYNPSAEKDGLKLDMERITEWTKKGARPTETVAQLIKKFTKEAKS